MCQISQVHLAVIGHISIVAVRSTVACELVDNILADTEIEENGERVDNASIRVYKEFIIDFFWQQHTPEHFLLSPVRVCNEAELRWDRILGWAVVVVLVVFTLSLQMDISRSSNAKDRE